MAPLNFPSSPVNGQQYTANGKTWVYSTATSSWLSSTNLKVDTVAGKEGVVTLDIADINGLTAALAAKAALASPALTGTPTAPTATGGTNTTQIATTAFVQSAISSLQNLDADLTAISALSGTGFLKRTGADTWALDSNTYLTGNQSISVTGDATGSGTTSIALTLANSGVGAGTYRSVTVDAKGRVTAGTNPTTLSGYGITDALSNSTTSIQSGYFGDIFLYDDSTPSHYLGITNSANLTAARTLSLNVNDANRTVSLSGNLTVSADATVSGTNTGDQTNISGNAATATSLAGGTIGQIPYQSAANTTAYLAAGTTGQFIKSAGAAAPTWSALAAGDIPELTMDKLPTAAYKRSVRAATTADLGASTFSAGVLTGFDDVVSLNVSTTVSSTTATTTSTAGLKQGAVISGNANIPAGATVASITNATTFVLSAAATATASSIATTFTQTIAALAVDGITLAQNDRVLVKNQTAGAQNGIYTLTTLGTTTVPWVLTRAADADAIAELDAALVNVDSGTTNGGRLFTNTLKSTDTLNTTAMPWYEVVFNDGTWAISTTGSATQFNGVTQPIYTASLRSNVNLSGGGTITFDASGNLLWSARFIAISNGNGAHFSTSGYFDITCPTSGTITGVGGASNKTATAAGIPLAAWEALYYILPIGSASTSVAANFRVASYTSALDIPHTWVLIAVRNGDNGMLYLPHSGNRLPVGTSIVTGTNDARRSASADVLTTSRNINGVAFNGSADITVADGTKLPLAGGTLTGGLTGTTGSFSGAVTWGAGASVMNAGNPRSLRIGYSGGNYGAAGYGIDFTTSSGTVNYAINDIVSWWEAYDGIIVKAAAAGTVGTAVSWTTVLEARRSNANLAFKGNVVLDAANYSNYALPLSGGTVTGNTSLQLRTKASFVERHYEWGGAQDLTWKRVARLASSATDGYRGDSGYIVVYDENSNHGVATRTEYHAKFYVQYASNGTPLDNPVILGSPGASSYIRLRKLAIRDYEVQVRQTGDWRLMGAVLQMDFVGGSTSVIDASGTPAASSAGVSDVTMGTLTDNINITGNAATATTLATARAINGVSFNGSADITVADGTKLPLAGGTMTGAITFAAGQTWPTFNQSTTGSAATLTTARTINGTSFNGSANITTANWGTARTLTIGSTGKSVDGSAAVSWTLGEIGALPLAGGTLTGALVVNTGTNSQFEVKAPGGTQSLWVRAGYDADGTATPAASALNVQFQSSGSSGGTFSFASGNTKVLAIGGGAVNSLVALQQSGNQVVHAGNVSSYALPIGGGTLTGALTGTAATLSGLLAVTGGSRIVVQNGTDGTNARGIFMWTNADSNWGIYMGQSGETKSLAGGTAATAIDGRTEHHIRFRAAYSTGQGFLWENSQEKALMSLTTDTGILGVRGGIAGVGTNLATSKSWAIGTGTQTGWYGGSFGLNGSTSENQNLYRGDSMPTPFASPGLVWAATNNDASSDADGGWNKNIEGLDPNKTYRSIVWFRRNSSSTNGTWYHGCGDCLTTSGNSIGNPYFQSLGISTFTQGRWYLSVGYIHANNDGTATGNYGGVYDSVTGARVYVNTDFRMAAGQTTQTHRTYLYYSTDPAAVVEWWGPRFEEVNGDEPSINALLMGSPDQKVIVTSTNVGSYALPISGGTLSGNLTVNHAVGSTNLQDGYGLVINGAYTNGQYSHRFRKWDDGGGVPLYVQITSGTAGTWTNIARFGANAGDASVFRVFGGETVEGQAVFTGGSGTTPGLVVNRNIASPTNYYNGLQLEVRATSGTAGIGLHRDGYSHVGIYHDAYNTLKFNMSSGTVTMNHDTGTVIGTGNYSSYALPLSGGTVTGATYLATSSGNVGVGTASTSHKLHVAGNAYASGFLAAGGDVIAYYSDDRLKTKVARVENALEKLNRLSGFLYVENDLARELGYNSAKQQVGVSAQEVQAVLPEAVTLAPVDMATDPETGEMYSKSGENYLTVKYERLVPLLIEAIKEQQAEIVILRDEVRALREGR